MREGRKLPGRSLFRVRRLSTNPRRRQHRESERAKGGGRADGRTGENAARIMTRRVSFETTCKQRCKHSEGKGWKWVVE